MSALLQLPSRRWQRLRLLGVSALALFVGLGCGGIGCPEGSNNVDGVCRKNDPTEMSEPPAPDAGVSSKERCDGIDNDGDDAVDEPWPELGEPCGEGRGECVQGSFRCAADGAGVVCEGAVGPSTEVCDGLDNDCDGVEDNGPAEVCDGEDNDCDGLIDEGVLGVKRESFDAHASVAAVDGGFALARLIGDQIRVETYDLAAARTGHHDDFENPVAPNAFLDSDASGGRLLVAFGQHRFYVLEASVDASLVPIVVDSQRLHAEWDQGIDWGIYAPPRHPRVVAGPERFVGHRDLITFALSPFGADSLLALGSAPTEAAGLVPYEAYFDAAGSFVVWEQAANVRAGWLLDDGSFLQQIDVARGSNPAIALSDGGPGVLFLQDGLVRLSELGGATLQCKPGGFCNGLVASDPIDATPTTATGLAYEESRDTWVLVAGEQVLLVGRGAAGPVVQQALESSIGDEPPRRVELAVSGGTAAIVQADERGDSVLTFMGCF